MCPGSRQGLRYAPHARDLGRPDRGGNGVLHRRRALAPLMRKFVREQSLSLFFLAIFLVALSARRSPAGTSTTRRRRPTARARSRCFRYVTGSDFGNAVMENWQSEYLQFLLFMLATVWLLQRGSPESKPLHKAGRESARRAEDRPPRRQRLAAVGARRRHAHRALLELAADRDGDHLRRLMVRAIGDWLDRLQRRPGGSRGGDASAGGATLAPPRSGRARSRTGSPSSSRSAPSRSSPSTCASAGRPSRSRSATRTRPPGSRAEPSCGVRPTPA